ncbi:Crp/Fnr family transcriptional regulator [Acidaminobacter hydrogenoformans]|uniref:cAMP-binding domain of CRP or a regulatory subunit of cAMP-dependent protein kinases n=1 Tax=Acidaminobacter hydrogenoformans DSM 2784 TaxID=1120920 RepID=A0A1G5RYR3_9FIRM|nr:Crp/Fnr family transcriptional regulator [Acidaminobacter hydrogenoformans]SCZ79193.1 cAMP-binding domain of CRP or a regulatory subunit of cAMP-dependent protein kinases [Acidaminobacter hydrogenoformans DSM 2784]
MSNTLTVLKRCRLFTNLHEGQIAHLLNVLGAKTVNYKKDTAIAIEGDSCERLGIVIEGKVDLQNILPSGKVVTLIQFGPAEVFGEALIFSKQTEYPVTITSGTACSILFIDKKEVVFLLTHHPVLLENFLGLLSDKLFFMNKKVKVLALETIRQKICDFILKEYKKQKKMKLDIPYSRKEMAELMSLQRPSLSRELINMREEGLIDFDKHTIEILDLEGVELEIL